MLVKNGIGNIVFAVRARTDYFLNSVCNFLTVCTGNRIHCISQINFFGGRFADSPIVIGNINANMNFFGTGVVGNVELVNILHRTADTPGSLPVTIMGDIYNQWSRFVMKHNNYGYGFYVMEVDGAGAWVATAKSPTLSDWQPITSLTAVGTAVTAVSAAHGYTTGNSVTISGASPNAYNGTKTITVSDVNTFTYTASTAPGSSPAIGQPMVKI